MIFLFYLHSAPGFNLQSASQHLSMPCRPFKPASHSSFPSIRSFPQNDKLSELKQFDFDLSTSLIEFIEHGEKN